MIQDVEYTVEMDNAINFPNAHTKDDIYPRVARITLAAVVLITAENIQLLEGIGITYALICIGLLIWYIFDQTRAPLKVLALAVGIVAFSLCLRSYFEFVDRIVPLKYDYILSNIDTRWLFDGTVCQRLTSRMNITWEVALMYEGLGIAAIFWYGWLLTRAQQKAPRFIKAILVAYLTGPLFYFLIPACGPLYTNGNGTGLLLLHGYPNCWPSLHLVTALLFVYYRPAGITATVTSVLMVLGTAFTTLATGQHYVVDLVVAVPFSGFVWAAVANRKQMALGLLLTVLVAGLCIHFQRL
jgi:hypothetical protein